MCIFIEIERISIREIKFEEIAVISHLKKPINPIIIRIGAKVILRKLNIDLSPISPPIIANVPAIIKITPTLKRI